ncbi:MAG: hypothetical protein GY940_39330 [bacterium]|nr:hypothetical protein [bacterium]
MKKTLISITLLLVFGFGAYAEKGFKGRDVINNVKMPTGHTVNKGEFIIGLGSIAFGVTDNVQVGTNIILYLAQDYNVNAKVNFIKTPSLAFAAGVKVHSFDLDVDDSESEAGFTSVSPYASLSTRVGTNTALHFGGQYSFFSGIAEIEDAVAIATSTGSSVSMGLEYSFSNKTKFLAETGYDFTFDGPRLGGAVLWGWSNFRLTLGINYFNPKESGSFIYPVFSLWWRFNG